MSVSVEQNFWFKMFSSAVEFLIFLEFRIVLNANLALQGLLSKLKHFRTTISHS